MEEFWEKEDGRRLGWRVKGREQGWEISWLERDRSSELGVGNIREW